MIKLDNSELLLVTELPPGLFTADTWPRMRVDQFGNITYNGQVIGGVRTNYPEGGIFHAFRLQPRDAVIQLISGSRWSLPSDVIAVAYSSSSFWEAITGSPNLWMVAAPASMSTSANRVYTVGSWWTFIIDDDGNEVYRGRVDDLHDIALGADFFASRWSGLPSSFRALWDAQMGEGSAFSFKFVTAPVGTAEVIDGVKETISNAVGAAGQGLNFLARAIAWCVRYWFVVVAALLVIGYFVYRHKR
jgi:hypothetical protein